MTTATQLIERSISDLQRLSTFLTNDASATAPSPAEFAPLDRLSKEAALTIRVLIEKLRAVHQARSLATEDAPIEPPFLCSSCQD